MTHPNVPESIITSGPYVLPSGNNTLVSAADFCDDTEDGVIECIAEAGTDVWTEAGTAVGADKGIDTGDEETATDIANILEVVFFVFATGLVVLATGPVVLVTGPVDDMTELIFLQPLLAIQIQSGPLHSFFLNLLQFCIQIFYDSIFY